LKLTEANVNPSRFHPSETYDKVACAVYCFLGGRSAYPLTAQQNSNGRANSHSIRIAIDACTPNYFLNWPCDNFGMGNLNHNRPQFRKNERLAKADYHRRSFPKAPQLKFEDLTPKQVNFLILIRNMIGKRQPLNPKQYNFYTGNKHLI